MNTDPYNCQLLMTPSSLVVRVAAGFTAEMMKGGNGTTLARVNSEKLGNGLELGSQVSFILLLDVIFLFHVSNFH